MDPWGYSEYLWVRVCSWDTETLTPYKAMISSICYNCRLNYLFSGHFPDTLFHILDQNCLISIPYRRLKCLWTDWKRCSHSSTYPYSLYFGVTTPTYLRGWTRLQAGFHALHEGHAKPAGEGPGTNNKSLPVSSCFLNALCLWTRHALVQVVKILG